MKLQRKEGKRGKKFFVNRKQELFFAKKWVILKYGKDTMKTLAICLIRG